MLTLRWLAKAGLQWALSATPRPDRANLFFQEHVTRTLPRSHAGFVQHVEEAAAHVSAYRSHYPLGPIRAYEFGAGWDLIGPLTLFAMGVESQTLVDIRANVRLDLVRDAARRIAEHRAELEERLGVELRPPDVARISSLGDLESATGIQYLAPRDARDTRLEPGSFDLISSTFTLEHIPKEDIGDILVESARLLGPNGLIRCSIDMKDHYSYFDSSLSYYSFLRYTTRQWKFLNPPLHFQNRLRCADYLDLFEGAGLTIIDRDVDLPTADERRDLAKVRLAPPFADRSQEQVGIKELVVVAGLATEAVPPG